MREPKGSMAELCQEQFDMWNAFGKTSMVLILLTASACGIKPGQVDAPQGNASEFPRVYPDLRTDPQSSPKKQ